MKKTALFVLVVALTGCGPATTETPSTAGTNPVQTTLPPLESLSREWDCGKGFWVSNPEQTAALHIRYRGEGPPPRVASLPHPDWEVEILQGTDLQANWCDDVAEPGEPVPREHSRLEVVGGELALVGDIPAGQGGGNALTVEAVDLEVELGDGIRERYGSITITNAHWGLIPG